MGDLSYQLSPITRNEIVNLSPVCSKGPKTLSTNQMMMYSLNRKTTNIKTLNRQDAQCQVKKSACSFINFLTEVKTSENLKEQGPVARKSNIKTTKG